MAKLTLNKRLGLKYTVENVDAAKIALILIDIWDNHWCPSIATQTNQLAKQVKALLPLIRNNGVLIIHSPSDCHKDYDPENPQAPPEVIARRKAFVESPFLKGVGVDPSTTPVFPPKLTPRYNRLDPLKNKQCPEGDINIVANWKCQNWHIEIKDPDIVAFENESNRIFKFLEGRKIEHLVYAGTATNYCVLWSRNTSMYTCTS